MDWLVVENTLKIYTQRKTCNHAKLSQCQWKPFFSQSRESERENEKKMRQIWENSRFKGKLQKEKKENSYNKKKI